MRNWNRYCRTCKRPSSFTNTPPPQLRSSKRSSTRPHKTRLPGPSAAERQVPVVRAREFAEQLCDEAKLTEALIALANLMCNRGSSGVREIAQQALASAERGDDAGLLAGAHYELGHVMYFCGEF